MKTYLYNVNSSSNNTDASCDLALPYWRRSTPHPRAYKRRTGDSRVLSERESGPGCDAQQQLDGKTDSIIIISQ